MIENFTVSLDNEEVSRLIKRSVEGQFNRQLISMEYVVDLSGSKAEFVGVNIKLGEVISEGPYDR